MKGCFNMMSLFQNISNWYLANGATAWASMDSYLHLAIVPVVLLAVLYYVRVCAKSCKDVKILDDIEPLTGCLRRISFGIVFIALIKYIIVFVSCAVSWLFRLC